MGVEVEVEVESFGPIDEAIAKRVAMLSPSQGWTIHKKKRLKFRTRDIISPFAEKIVTRNNFS